MSTGLKVGAVLGVIHSIIAILSDVLSGAVVQAAAEAPAEPNMFHVILSILAAPIRYPGAMISDALGLVGIGHYVILFLLSMIIWIIIGLILFRDSF
ncbi:hypothetical protein ACFL0W_03860 [Nanoarchaeota archaeon]